MPAYSVLALGNRKKKCWSIYREITFCMVTSFFILTHIITSRHLFCILVGAEMFYFRDLNNFLNGLLEHFDTRFT